MTLVIDLTPEVEQRLQEAAQNKGVETGEYVRRLLETHLPPTLTEKQKAAIALLQSWREEDATDDPEEIARAEAELAEFKHSLNENRAREEPIFL